MFGFDWLQIGLILIGTIAVQILVTVFSIWLEGKVNKK